MVTTLALILLLSVFYLVFIARYGQRAFNYQKAFSLPNKFRTNGVRKTVHFSSVDGTIIEAWLYLPYKINTPIIIMAPGLTSTKETFLEEMAWEFIETGIAVLQIDFRTFGGSDGAPRHWVSPKRHTEDYLSAITFIQNELAKIHSVDTTRIAIWGSSFSGGIAINLAAKYPHIIKAVIAQVPYLKNSSNLEPKGFMLIRFVFFALIDSIRSFVNSKLGIELPPVYIPTFGKLSEFAFSKSNENPAVKNFNNDGNIEFWNRVPKTLRGGWENKMLARALIEMGDFKPMDSIPQITEPIYLISAIKDDQVLHEFIIEAYYNINHTDKKLTSFDCGHYDIYLGDILKQNAQNQAKFLSDVFYKVKT